MPRLDECMACKTMYGYCQAGHFGFMDLGILTGYRRHLRVSVEWRMPLRCVLAEGSTELAKARLCY